MELLEFYSLYYIDEKSADSPNLRVNSKKSQHKQYLENSIALNKSLLKINKRLTIITNKKNIVEGVYEDCGFSTEERPFICEKQFSLELPDDLAFSSPHRKIEVFDFFSKMEGNGYYVLLDLDMYFIPSTFPDVLADLVIKNIPTYYDISDQAIPAYGAQRIKKDMQIISSEIFEPRWIGGEWIGGNAKFFMDLHKKIQGFYDVYINRRNEMHHQGDEALTSVAMQQYFAECGYASEIGALKLVSRYWNTKTKHPQMPLKAALQSCFIHLPNGKDFLAKLAYLAPLSASEFERRYFLYRCERIIKIPKRLYMIAKLKNKIR